jgi:hypothetical protein
VLRRRAHRELVEVRLADVTAPAAFRRATTVQSITGTKFSSMREDAVVRTPFVESRSFTPTGCP